MHHLEHGRVGQQRPQRFGDAGRQRVDQQDPVADGHLHQRQLRPVGALADEFGIQPHPFGRGLQLRAQCGGFIYPKGHEIST